MTHINVNRCYAELFPLIWSYYCTKGGWVVKQNPKIGYNKPSPRDLIKNLGTPTDRRSMVFCMDHNNNAMTISAAVQYILIGGFYSIPAKFAKSN